MFYFAMGVAAPYFPVVLEVRGLTPSQIGLTFTISNIAAGLSSYYIGRLSDRVGRLKILLSSTVLTAIMYLLLALISNPYVTVAIFTLLMVGMGSSNTVVTAYSIDALERAGISRGSGFGSIRIGGSIGWIPGTFLGGALVSLFGLRSIFLFAPLVIGLSVLTMRGLGEDGRFRRRDSGNATSLSLLRGAPGVLLLTMTLAFVANSSILSFLSLHMINTLGASPLEVSTAFALMGLTEIPAMVYLGKISDRVGRRPVLLLCLVAFPVRLAISGLSPDKYIVILAQALNSFTFGGLYVVSIAYASELVPERMRGAYMGLYGATFNAGGVIGGYLWGSIAEATSYASMFQYSALFSLIPVALTGVSLKRQSREVYSAPVAP
ncbi:Sugar efflux transporter C [Candidatus Calditenuaceae archaeon HR02]|nr:Sugar efflux transporter C [Candidatus Calditenuaceae archaeon HR02]